jgi:hypothetical protein
MFYFCKDIFPFAGFYNIFVHKLVTWHVFGDMSSQYLVDSSHGFALFVLIVEGYIFPYFLLEGCNLPIVDVWKHIFSLIVKSHVIL